MSSRDPATTVDAAARARVRRVLSDFDNVLVAFSGGKDSGALLHLVREELRRRPGTDRRRVHVLHVDYEAQFSATTAYVDQQLAASRAEGLVVWRLCLPVAVPSATTALADHWTPWDPAARGRWVRELPDHEGVVHAGALPDGFPDVAGMWDHELQDAFSRWHHAQHGARRTAVLVGIREQESLHRYAAIHRHDKHAMHDGLRWTSVVSPGVVKAYPVHDWTLADVWHAHARWGWPYNRLYDLLHQAGIAPHQMRVSSPFIGQGIHQLRLYRVVEPQVWTRLVERTTGANFAALHGGTAAMGGSGTRLPPGHTWHSFLMLLLDTLPEATRARYVAKFSTSVRYWTDRGGALPLEVVRELQRTGVDAEFLGPPQTSRQYGRPHEVVRFARYPDDLPGIRPASAVPTYRRMCLAVLRNDHTCRSLGFGPTRRERERSGALVAALRQERA